MKGAGTSAAGSASGAARAKGTPSAASRSSRRRRRVVELDGQAAYAVLAADVVETKTTVVICAAALQGKAVLGMIVLPPHRPSSHATLACDVALYEDVVLRKTVETLTLM